MAFSILLVDFRKYKNAKKINSDFKVRELKYYLQVKIQFFTNRHFKREAEWERFSVVSSINFLISK